MKVPYICNYMVNMQYDCCIQNGKIETRSIEDTDPDEFALKGATVYTEAVETSDPDEIYYCGSHFTKSVETSDPDELGIYSMGSSVLTFTKEDSDPDELH